jgi:hypothetical protein
VPTNLTVLEGLLETSNGPDGRLSSQDRIAQQSWHPGDNLTPLEQEMVDDAQAGELVDLGGGGFTPTEMKAWADGRTIRAAVLRHLLVDGQWPVSARGVQLRSVRISGHLNLEGEALRCPLSLDCCYFDGDEPICLDHASASQIILTRCQLPSLSGEMLAVKEFDLRDSTLTGPLRLKNAYIAGRLSCHNTHLTGADSENNALHADWMKVGGGLFLDGTFTAAGAVRLPGADITGPLVCSGAQLNGTDPDGNALHAAGIKVSGGVYLESGFTAAGAVRLTGADITGQLSFRDGHLTGTDRGNALVADGLKVVGGVFLIGEFTAAGTVRLPGADITGPLVCSGAQLNGADPDGNALHADWMKVGGGVFLDNGFSTTTGAIRLRGADITGPLSCHSAQLNGTDRNGNALNADWVKIGGGVFLDEGFSAAGAISLVAANTRASIYLIPAALAGEEKLALNAARAQIGDTLRWAPAVEVLGQVNLEGATVGQLEDVWSRERPNGFWPDGGKLRLTGFTYDRFGGDHRATMAQRLAWIRSQYKDDNPAAFAAQPYEQLAAVYRRAGQDGQARKVAIARRADLRTYGNLNPYRKAGNWLLDKTIKYGYQSWRAGLGLAALFVIFTVLSFFAQQHHLIVPEGNFKGATPSATNCTSTYPCFYPAGYSVDTVIPIINVHQADNWGPDGAAPWGQAFVTASWVATAVGWALATLLVAGYTGLVRQD